MIPIRDSYVTDRVSNVTACELRLVQFCVALFAQVGRVSGAVQRRRLNFTVVTLGFLLT